jgi:hypothetical protein
MTSSRLRSTFAWKQRNCVISQLHVLQRLNLGSHVPAMSPQTFRRQIVIYKCVAATWCFQSAASWLLVHADKLGHPCSYKFVRASTAAGTHSMQSIATFSSIVLFCYIMADVCFASFSCSGASAIMRHGVFSTCCVFHVLPHCCWYTKTSWATLASTNLYV